MTEQNGNGTRMSWSVIVTLLAIIGGFGAVVRPMQQAQDSLQRQIDVAQKWQDDYMRGLIPSSAERELAAQKMQFVEVETQFRGQKDKIERDEKEIERLRDQVGNMREQIAVLRHDN